MPDISSEPLTLAEVKKALHIADKLNDHDEDIEELIVAVRKEAETLTGTPIVEVIATQWLDRWPVGDSELDWWDGIRDGAVGADTASEIELLPGYIKEVTSVAIYGEDDERNQINQNVYFADYVRNRLVLRAGMSWPTFHPTVGNMRRANGIEILIKMGWATRALMPVDLRERMKERCVQRWRHRGDPKQKTNAIDWLFYGPYTNLKFGLGNR